MFQRKLLNELTIWRNSSSRKPLIIRGARQVGKTTLVHLFSKQFKQYIYLNLEVESDKKLFQNNPPIHELVNAIFYLKEKVLSLKSDTLLFIDEIQEVPNALNLLRYFKEEIPELPVIAAGSVLESLLGKTHSFPVGRVNYMILRPVSFEEYLLAKGEQQSLEQLTRIPYNSYAFDKLMTLFHEYAFIGGMPEIVANFIDHGDKTSLKSLYQSLLNGYIEDTEKYDQTDHQTQLLRFCLQQIPYNSGKRITFQGFGNSNYKSREIGEALRALEKTHLIQLIYPTISTELPLMVDNKKSPRLHFLDTGLMNFSLGIQNELIQVTDLNSVYKGSLIEHLIGQELLAHQSQPLDKLDFWVREKNSSQAELDYIVQYKGKIVPIEVKSGAVGTLKSLKLYMELSNLPLAIRFYSGPIEMKKMYTGTTTYYTLLSLPYFLATQLENYIAWFFSEYTIPNSNNSSLEEPKTIYIGASKKVTPLIKLSSKHITILQHCMNESLSGRELLEEKLKITYQSKNKRIYLGYLMEREYIEWTDKNNVKSKQQRYQITENGRMFLNDLRNTPTKTKKTTRKNLII